MKKILRFVTAAVLSLVMSGCYMPSAYTPEIPENPRFAVHYIDVGQADAAIVECDGETMIIDGGNVGDSRKIASYLKECDISHIDYAVCTHAHEDHVGGLSAALSVADAEHVLAPSAEANTKAYKNFKKKVKEQGLKTEHPSAGDVFFLGNGRVDILGPTDDKADDLNNTSIVLKITYGSTSFLFTGDAEREEEEEIIQSGADLKSTVLKVGHHGSATSSSYPFLRAVMPEISVISVGKDNSYGHPDENTLSRITDTGSELYRTDLNGGIVITSDGEDVYVETEK